MKKNVFALLVAFVLLVGLCMAVPVAEATEATTHEDHCICGGTSNGVGDHACETVTWEAWPADNAWESGKHYYLTGDVSLSSTITLTSGQSLSVCLNGHTMSSTVRMFTVEGTLNLTDCQFEEASESSYADYIFKGTFSSSYGGTSAYAPIFYTRHGADMRIFGGNFVSTAASMSNSGLGTISTDPYWKSTAGDEYHYSKGAASLKIYNGHLQGRTVTGDGGAINSYHANASLTIYGGVIEGGTAGGQGGNLRTSGVVKMYGGVIADGVANSTTSNCGGGNVRAGNTFYLYGGLVTGGYAAKDGGNFNQTGNNLWIYGGEITKGWCGNEGGNIRHSSWVHMDGGSITDGGCDRDGNVVTNKGGNVQSFTTFYHHGGTISGGKAKSAGGNVSYWVSGSGNGYLMQPKQENGGDGTPKVLAGEAPTGGNICLGGSGTYDSTNGKVHTIAGTVSGGIGTDGGNIHVYCNRNLLTISGGTISGGEATNGAGLYCSVPVTISGGTISGGEASVGGGAVYVTGTTLAITGGTFTGNAKYGGGLAVANGATVNLNGGTVENCTATSEGGGVYINSGTSKLVVNGGTIQNNTANGGGNVCCFGNFQMDSGSLIGGTAKAGRGANLYSFASSGGNPTIDINGGLISGGTNETKNGEGGSISLAANKNFTDTVVNATIDNATIVAGSATYGNAICASNGVNLTVNNTTITDGAESGYAIWVKRDAGHTRTTSTVTIGENVKFEGTNGNLFVNNVDDAMDYMTVDLTAVTEPVTVGANRFGKVADGADNDLVSAFYEGNDILYRNGELFLTYGAGIAQVGDTKYYIFDEAVAAAEGKYVKLLISDINGLATLTSDLYLDLAGFTLDGIIDQGEFAIYGMDSATDGYDDTNMGQLVATLTGTPETHFKSDITGAIKRYVAVPTKDAEENITGYTFHRIYLSITHVTFQPSAVGVGYKAIFAGDETVKGYLDAENSYGVVLQVGTKPVELVDGCYAPFTDFTAGLAAGETRPNDKSILVQGVDLAYADTNIYGCAYMKLADGTLIMSNAVEPTLKDVVKLMDSNWAGYSQTQQNSLNAFYTANKDVVSTWGLENIGKE